MQRHFRLCFSTIGGLLKNSKERCEVAWWLGRKAEAKGLETLKSSWDKLFPYIDSVGLFRVIGADAERDEGLPVDWSTSG